LLDGVRLRDAFEDRMPHATEIWAEVREKFKSAGWEIDVWEMTQRRALCHFLANIHPKKTY
jgi:hypothetical protein